MLETLILTLIYSKYKKNNVKYLFQQKEIYYVLAIELVYVCIQAAIFADAYTFIKYASLLKSIYLCSYLGLVFKHELYKEAILGSGFVLLGGLCNDLAIRANGGTMPVFPSLSYLTGYASPEGFEMAQKLVNDYHVLGNEETKLKFLTDIFDIGYSVLSMGDVFIRVFVVLIIFSAVKKLNTFNRNIK